MSLTAGRHWPAQGVKLTGLTKKSVFRAENGIFFKSSFYTKMICDPKYNFSLGQKYLTIASFKDSIFHQIEPHCQFPHNLNIKYLFLNVHWNVCHCMALKPRNFKIPSQLPALINWFIIEHIEASCQLTVFFRIFLTHNDTLWSNAQDPSH